MKTKEETKNGKERAWQDKDEKFPFHDRYLLVGLCWSSPSHRPRRRSLDLLAIFRKKPRWTGEEKKKADTTRWKEVEQVGVHQPDKIAQNAVQTCNKS